MSGRNQTTNVYRTLERTLAFLGALNCVVVPFLFASNQRPLFPLPGLYFIEIALFGLFGLTSIVAEQSPDSRWRVVPWIVSGGLLAFVILGALSIGYFLIPAMVAFLGAGFLADRRRSREVAKHGGVFLIAAVLQATIMLALLVVADPNL